MCQWDSLFWFSLFGALNASCTLIGVFFYIRKISFYDLLKIFSLSSSIPIILRIGLFTVSWISWTCFLLKDLTFSLTIYSVMFSILGILSSISCILLARLASEIPVWVSKFLYLNFPQFGFLYWFYFFIQVLNCFIYFLPLFEFL